MTAGRDDVFVFEWLKALTAAGLGDKVVLVGVRLALYGNGDGTSIFPGVKRLAADLDVSEPTVKRALKVLRDLGWIVVVQEARRADERGKATEYRLALPATSDHLDDLRSRASRSTWDQISADLGSNQATTRDHPDDLPPDHVPDHIDQQPARARDVGSILEEAGVAEDERGAFLDNIGARSPGLVQHLHSTGQLSDRVAEFQRAGGRRRPQGYAERQDAILARERERARAADAAAAAVGGGGAFPAVATIEAGPTPGEGEVLEAEVIDEGDPWVTGPGGDDGDEQDPFATDGGER